MTRGASGKIFASLVDGFGRALVVAAMLAASGALTRPASANQCAAACYSQHNQCRIQTKGSPSCDAALTQCLRGCNSKR